MKRVLIFLLFATQAFAGLPPTTMKGQTDATSSVTFGTQAPHNQITRLSGTSALIETGNQNLLKNPGWEGGTTDWSASGGTFTTTTTAANIGSGAKAASWNSSAASQTLTSTAVAIPAGAYGRNGVASCNIQGTSATHTLQAYDGTNILASQSISSLASYSRTSINFPFPTSGNIQLRLVSVAADEPIIYIDDCYLGLAEGYNLAQLNQVTGWTSYTPTLTWTSGISSNVAKYRRVGGMLEVSGHIVTSGAVTAATLNVSLPSGMTIDTSIINSIGGENGTLGLFSALDTGTNIYEGRVTYNNTSTIGLGTHNVTGTYSTPSGVTNAVPFTWGATDELTYNFSVPILGWQAETAYRPDQTAWRVDANIVGANPSLGTSAVTTYTGITNGSLTLTQNAGSIAAQIPCAGTTESSGTTCTAADESIGVSFTAPVAGDALACASFTWSAITGAAIDYRANAAFQIVETGNANQTIIQEGKSRIKGLIYTVAAVALTGDVPFRVCGTFNFTSIGKKTLRLMYEQSIGGTISSSIILADADGNNGQRDIHWEVYPLGTLFGAPLLVGSVTSNSSGMERSERATITGGNPPSIASQSGAWLTYTSRTGAGDTTWAMTGFTSAPSCTVSPIEASSTSSNKCHIYSLTSTAVRVACGFYGGTGAAITGYDYNFNLNCQGPR